MAQIGQRSNRPLAAKIVIAMLVVTAIPLAVVGFLNVRGMHHLFVQTLARDLFAEKAQEASITISTFLAEQTAILRTMALTPEVQQALLQRNATYQGSQEEIVASLLALDKTWRQGSATEPLIAQTLSRELGVNPVTYLLAHYQNTFKDHVEIFLTDVHGGTLGSTNRLSDYYQADKEWWQAAYNQGKGALYISDPAFDESAKVVAVLIALPVISTAEAGKILGVLRTTVVLDAVLRQVADIRVGATGRATLLTGQGVMIAPPHGQSTLPLPATLAAQFIQMSGDEHTVTIAPDESGTSTIFGVTKVRSTAGEKYAWLQQALDSLGWIAIMHQSHAEALAPVTRTIRLAVVILALTALIALIVAFSLSRVLTRQVQSIQEVCNAIEQGNYDARIEVLSGDELGRMADSLNAMLDHMVALMQSQGERDATQNSIMQLLDEISSVADGDLTVEAEVTPDITGAIADYFNHMIVQLRTIVAQVQEATLQVSSSTNEIQAAAEYLAQGSTSQAAQIIDSSAALDEMAVSIQQVSENATLSATVAQQALVNARHGNEAVQNTIQGMDHIRHQVQETGRRIKRLGERSQEIGEIVQLIGDIADRTGILALNASIQAARAGEAGRAFTVVAEEVERLAERSAKATKQIAGLVTTIQSETNEAMVAMNESTREVVAGSQLAEQAGQALREIEGVSTRLAELIQSISLAASQQARGSDNLSKAMGEIAEVTQQSAAGTKQATVSINNLAFLADELRNSVSTFKLPETSNGHVRH